MDIAHGHGSSTLLTLVFVLAAYSEAAIATYFGLVRGEAGYAGTGGVGWSWTETFL